MKKDRSKIYEIISNMLDNPDEHEIYPTTICYNALEQYIESQRMQAIGWAHADACISLDEGSDPRKKNVPDMIKRAKIDLDK